ncbi:MAG: metallophosphoesterase [Terriglobales bacterium]
MKKFLFIAFGIICLAAGIWSVAIEPNLLFVKYYTVELPRWPAELDGMKVALISDVHAGSLYIDRKKIAQIVDKTNAENPDLILLLGDYVSAMKVFAQ